MGRALLAAIAVGVAFWLFWRKRPHCECAHGAPAGVPPQSPVDQPTQQGAGAGAIPPGPVMGPAPVIDPSTACQAGGGIWDMWAAMTGGLACKPPQTPAQPAPPPTVIVPPSFVQPPLRMDPRPPTVAPLVPPPADPCTSSGGARGTDGACHCGSYSGSDGKGGCLPPTGRDLCIGCQASCAASGGSFQTAVYANGDVGGICHCPPGTQLRTGADGLPFCLRGAA